MKKLTDITIILDRSGSMSAVRDATINGFNEFLTKQKAEKGKANVTLVQFDDKYETHYSGVNIKSAPDLSYETFVPRGWTALNDAIGRTIDSVGARLNALPEKERPNNVIFVILTDGYENRSTEYTKPQIAEKIKHQQDKYNWNFIFIGANQDAITTGKTYNIPLSNSITYTSNTIGINNVFGATSDVVTASRLGKQISYTNAMRKAAIEKDENYKSTER